MNRKKIIALGFFDGVHLGHRALLQRCSELARETGCETAAITFERHPQSLYREETLLISTAADREHLLRRYGMETVICLPVTKEVMSTPWETFLEELLELGAAGFVCGDDFRFGFRGEGNSEKLKTFCRQRQLPCIVVPEQTVDGIRVSSTYIRRQIAEGDMATAVKFLGHPYVLTGTVVPGKQLGRTLGIPTANIRFPQGIVVPKFGVYACRVRVGEETYPAVTNIGTRPTVDGRGITVEPWILDFEGDLYGQEIRVEFHYFLRPEQKFASLEELKQEIHRDADRTLALLKDAAPF